MKTIVLTSLAFFALVSLALASPFLVCDPYDPGVGVENFIVTLNGVTYDSAPVGEALRFDLAGKWQPGLNNVSVKAVNMWGESLASPLVFDASVPAAPSGVGLQK